MKHTQTHTAVHLKSAWPPVRGWSLQQNSSVRVRSRAANSTQLSVYKAHATGKVFLSASEARRGEARGKEKKKSAGRDSHLTAEALPVFVHAVQSTKSVPRAINLAVAARVPLSRAAVARMSSSGSAAQCWRRSRHSSVCREPQLSFVLFFWLKQDDCRNHNSRPEERVQ